MAKETKTFQAEVKQILDLMIHSLYSQKEIFLRELISNSSDALDKLRVESKSQSWDVDTSSPLIRLQPDVKNKTLAIVDNGIGMSFEEVEENIGTIARSGTGQYLMQLQEMKDQPELIGQFGVGFYSAFMVADKITLHTQKPGEENGVLWESNGDGTYTIDQVPRPGGHGTTVTLQLKEDLDQDFTEEWVLKGTVKKYSDFISFPIKMNVEREEPVRNEKGEPVEGKTEKVITDEVLNSQKALWLKSPSEIKEEDYKEFYKHITHDWSDPQKHIHFKAEGTQEFSSLMYIPSQKPFDFHTREQKWGLQLYVKRVFIMDHCEELLPAYLRFVKGVVDSSDLSLNVSREILQQDHQVQAIQKALTSKVLKQFKEWMKSERKEYEKMYDLFGATIKEGVHNDYANKDKIMDLLLFKTTKSEDYISLAEYVEKKPKDQKSIFYMTGDKHEEIKASPVLEKFEKKGFEVLLCTDPIDEWVTSSLDKYKDLEFQSVLDENLDIDTEEEKKEQEEKNKKAEKEFESVLQVFKNELKDQVKDAKISSRLDSSPVCLVSSSQDPSARMERIMSAIGKDVPKSKRVLEINPEHKVIQRMMNLDDHQRQSWAKVLYSQALLQEGSPIENPVHFSQELTRLMETL